MIWREEKVLSVQVLGPGKSCPCAKLGHLPLLKAWTLQTSVMPKGRCPAFCYNQK